jgi:2-dehydro-3-deoxygluconokinase
MSEFPNLRCAVTTLRVARSATRNDWGGACRMDGRNHLAPLLRDIEVFDRIGGGDAFAAGVIYGLITGKGPQWAVECGVAHGALTMTTPRDNSMATLAEVEPLMKGPDARALR